MGNIEAAFCLFRNARTNLNDVSDCVCAEEFVLLRTFISKLFLQ